MKRLSYFILLALLMSLTSTPVLADTFTKDGIHYNILSGTTNVEVTYNQNYDRWSVPDEDKYTGSVTIPSTVTNNNVPYTVTKIGLYAFYECTGLTSVTIPNTVTSIDIYAFNRSGLTSITIPASVTSIGEDALSECSGLTSMVVESGNTIYDSRNDCNAIIKKSGNELVAGCKNTVIPSTVTKIGDNAFYGSTGLTSITIPNSVTSIGISAFNTCTGLTSITIPNSVTTIGMYAFSRCTSLTSIPIPNSVTTISNSAFYGCTGFTSITIPNGVTTISSCAFRDCINLTSVTIPSSVTSINYDAFKQCNALTSIVVESGNTIYDSRDNCNAVIKKTGNELVLGCKNTVIPNTVTKIGENALTELAGLTSITIPSSVTSIEMYAISYCNNLASVYFLGAKPTIKNANTSLTNRATVYVPLQYLDSYRGTGSNDGKINAEKLYPMLSPSTAYSTFSFDKAVDLSSIAGLNNPGNTLTAYYVSAVNTGEKKVTLSKLTGEVAAGEGIIIKGTGAEGEFYPIGPATGETLSLTNYMQGVGKTATAIAEPVDGKQRYFIMNGSGDFNYCSGGTLPAYKAYLDIVTPIAVGGASSAKGFSIVFEDEESTDINGIAETKGAQAEAWYTIGGQRLQGKPSTKGLYIVNGKKIVIK